MKFYRKKRYWILLGIVLVIGGFIRSGGSSEADSFEYTELVRGDIERTVSVTGVVQPVDRVDLAFEQSGRVARVPVKVGDTVYKGQLLAVLANGDIHADIASASARVDAEKARVDQYAALVSSAQIKLRELLNGARPEELAIKQAALDTAVFDYEKSVSDTTDVLTDASSDLDYAVDVTLGTLFFGQQSTSFDLAYSNCDVQLATDVGWRRSVVGASLDAWRASVPVISFEDEAKIAINEALVYAADAEGLALQLSQTLSDDCTRANTTFDSYRASVDTALSSITTTRNALLTHRQLLTSRGNAMEKADADYQLALVGPRSEVIAVQEQAVAQAQAQYEQQSASVRQAEASVSLLRARAGKTVIVSPLAGKVLKQDIKVGEIATAYNSVMRIATDGAYEIETFIAEVDIADVVLGQEGLVTLDAYTDDIEFMATVVQIEQAETVKEGVPTYKTTLLFAEADERIQSGMTADVDIIIDAKSDVIVTPVRSVISKDGKRFVRTFVDGEGVVEHEVVVGLKGSDGNIELVEFELSEDEEIILFKK